MSALAAPPFVNEDHIWFQTLERPEPGSAVLFLDRDGVLVEDTGYLHEPDKVAVLPGAADLIRRANARELPVIVVTNQGGIGLGKYGWDAFSAVQEVIMARLADEGARLDAVLACPFHERGNAPYAHPRHPDRKPEPGMLDRARDAFALDMGKSWIVGDRARDLEAGKRAGLPGGVHLLTAPQPGGEKEAALALAGDAFEVRHCGDLRETAHVLFHVLFEGSNGPK